MKSIIIVDDEINILKSIQRSLRESDWELHIFTAAVEALNYGQENNIDLVISDYRMPHMDGIQFLKEFKKIQPDAFRIILSGQADLDLLLEAINEVEIYRFITKPWIDSELKKTIGSALNHHEILQENRILANQVRDQKRQISLQKIELDRLEMQSPGITQVNWDTDGSIIIGDDEK